MLILYTMSGACSLSDHIALVWAGIPYKAEVVTREEASSEAFKKINPAGCVPALKKGDWVLTQNLGIMHYIVSLSSKANIGPSATPEGGAKFYSLFGYLNSDVHSAFTPIFAPQIFSTNPSEYDDIVSMGKQRVGSHLNVIDKMLEGVDYLYENRKTVLDAYLFVMLKWVNADILDNYANLKAYADRMFSDAGVQQAMKEEGLI